MPRRFVNELSDHESVDEIFQASGKQLRPNRNGNLYLQVELSDRSGSVSGRLWNATNAMYRSFEDGDYVRVEGTSQVYQGAMQMIVTNIHRVSGNEITLADFMPHSPLAIDKLTLRLAEMLRGMSNPHLKSLAECFLLDEEFMRKFTRAPAGVKNHHAYLGGLLEHVVNLMEIALAVAPFYPAIDVDLLLMGAFLHDMGKIDELAYDQGFSYTDEGQLIGHLVTAVGTLDGKVRETEKLSGESIPVETVLRLKHMIVSHHGEYEYGSPKLPMTLEAVALAELDSMYAKVHSFQQQMRDDPNVDSPWTVYNAQIGRKLFKGYHSGTATSAD